MKSIHFSRHNCYVDPFPRLSSFPGAVGVHMTSDIWVVFTLLDATKQRVFIGTSVLGTVTTETCHPMWLGFFSYVFDVHDTVWYIDKTLFYSFTMLFTKGNLEIHF